MKKLKITQKRSLIGQPEAARKVAKALGLRGVNSVVIQNDNNCIRGMVNKIHHIITYEFV